MMDEIEWWEFDSSGEMAEQVAGDIGFVIDSAIEAHGGARLAVTGGKACDVVYDALLKQDIDWSKVTLIPTDDRLVPLDHDYSTYNKLTRLFEPKGATIVSLVDEAALDDYREAGRLADERLKLVEWPLDLVWLGVAPDGHVAGLFPGPDLDRAISGPRERKAVGLRPEPMPEDVPYERVTLTARAVMVVLSGAERRQVLEEALKDGPLSAKPIGRLLAEMEAATDIFWSAS
jgi:6-phosphogluconolactonase